MSLNYLIHTTPLGQYRVFDRRRGHSTVTADNMLDAMAFTDWDLDLVNNASDHPLPEWVTALVAIFEEPEQ